MIFIDSARARARVCVCVYIRRYCDAFVFHSNWYLADYGRYGTRYVKL